MPGNTKTHQSLWTTRKPPSLALTSSCANSLASNSQRSPAPGIPQCQELPMQRAPQCQGPPITGTPPEPTPHPSQRSPDAMGSSVPGSLNNRHPKCQSPKRQELFRMQRVPQWQDPNALPQVLGSPVQMTPSPKSSCVLRALEEATSSSPFHPGTGSNWVCSWAFSNSTYPPLMGKETSSAEKAGT